MTLEQEGNLFGMYFNLLILQMEEQSERHSETNSSTEPRSPESPNAFSFHYTV